MFLKFNHVLIQVEIYVLGEKADGLWTGYDCPIPARRLFCGVSTPLVLFAEVD